MKSLIALSAIALAACGGGGGSSPTFAPPAQSTPAAEVQAAPSQPAPVVQVAAASPPQPVNTNCVTTADGHVSCDLIADDQPIGVGVPAGTYVIFTNRTTDYLQINSVSAFTGEQQRWSEFCVDRDDGRTGQASPGIGEVGCTTKNVGEDYPPITWGNGTGLSVPPGGVIYLGSHTEPVPENHTYSMSVAVQTTGLNAWRQPQQDAVITCDGQLQSTAWTPWQNTTDHDLHLAGASVYAVSSSPSSPNTLSGAACIYVIDASGATKYTNCDDALRTRGDANFPVVTIAPGEFVAAQATNACASPAVWDWVAFLRVW